MSINCRVNVNSKGEVTSILAPNGKASQLFKNLKNTLGDKAKQVYAITETEGFKKFADSLRFAASRPQTTPPENRQKQTAKLVTEYLKSKGQNISILSEKDMLEEVRKRGYDSFEAMVTAYHGSPYKFDKFSTNNIGTGEGAQAFGWGLYFTDLESIARNYAKDLTQEKINSIKGFEITNKNLQDFEYYNNELQYLGARDRATKALEELKKTVEENKQEIGEFSNSKIKEDIDYVSFLKQQVNIAENVISEANNYLEKFPFENLYEASLFKDKDPSEYTWLEWDKPVSEKQLTKVYNQWEKEFKSSTKSLTKDGKTIGWDRMLESGKNLYDELMRQMGTEKASLFLLRAGIDGIKYPAESISRGATSDNARGFNYVVFDENAVKIEQNIQFLNNGEKIHGFYDTNTKEIYLTEELLSSENLVHEMYHAFKPVLEQKTDETSKAVLKELEKLSLELLGGEQVVENRYNKETQKDTGLNFSMQNNWFSNALKGISKIQQKSATPEQWVKMIADKGGKGTTQELDWIGLQDYLNDYLKDNNSKSIPKEVVEQYINDNQIEIVEVSKKTLKSYDYDEEIEKLEKKYENKFSKEDLEKMGIVFETLNKEQYLEKYGESKWSVNQFIDDSIVMRANIPNKLVEKLSSKVIEVDFGTMEDLVKDISREVAYDESEVAEFDNFNPLDQSQPKYSEYQLEGGDSYREVLLTLPSKRLTLQDRKSVVKALKEQGLTVVGSDIFNEKGEQVFRTRALESFPYGTSLGENKVVAKNKEQNDLIGSFIDASWKAEVETENSKYKSAHWDEANILAHLRVNERTLPNGERTIFVEEIQADIAKETKDTQDKFLKEIDKDFDNVLDQLIKEGVIEEEC